MTSKPWLPRGGLTQGFSLITVLIWVVVLGIVSLLLHLRLVDQLETLPASERQLYSLVMAQNGIEFARSRLPGLRINSLLVGADRTHAGTSASEWRNPVSWSKARTTDPALVRLTPDDGLITTPGGGALGRGYAAPGDGYFFLRLSNNPEEPAWEDRDGVVLVRSLGVARSRLPALTLGGTLHSTSLVEARLRQERVFELQSALTLFAERGDFRWNGRAFQVQGGERSAIALIPQRGGALPADLAGSLSPQQRTLIRGGASPWADHRPLWRQDSQKRRVFQAAFWNHFLEHLPEFSEPVIPGLRYLPQGGVIDDEFRGVVIARGDLRLKGDARITGLLLHLGGGALELRGRATIQGAVWMSSSGSTGISSGLQPIQLRVSGQTRLSFDADAVDQALGRFPPTQLGWRLLFPESIQ